MARTEDAKAESETIILWNEASDIARLWTASVRVKREWESFGFPVQGGKDAWTTEIPINRITYKMLSKK